METLPELRGSEKQVAWAKSLRQKALDKIREICVPADDPEKQENFARFMDWVQAHDSASWWIDNRDMTPRSVDALVKAWYAEQEAQETPEEAALREAAESEMITAPQVRTHSGVVKISATAAEVSVTYERDDDFRAIVKELGYRWNADLHCWAKAIDETTGAAAERAAELGSNLLNAGFAVQIADPEITAAAVTGQYQPEHRRWITLYMGDGPHKGWLCIRLVYGEDMYEKAHAIRGSQYVKPNIAVPVKRWAEVLDFASLYDYRISAKAQKAIDTARASVVTVVPAPVKAATYSETNPADVLKSSADVLPDLLEDK